mgnify:CR=1 FL=1
MSEISTVLQLTCSIKLFYHNTDLWYNIKRPEMQDEMNMKKQKKDWILIGGLLAIALLTAIGFWLFSDRGTQVTVYVDGEEVGRWSLEASVDEVIQTEAGSNRLVIKDGKAAITEADCPDEICIKQGQISRTGQTIVCLPHKLVIEVEGKAGENELDAIAK